MTACARPTPIERLLGDEDFIVSKTDLKGRITFGNRTFMAFAGFSEPELLGRPHSIIRHPDMPRAVFELLWTTIQAGREFNGYVKNMAKDGSFYWAFANVTPCLGQDGRINGYFSVRRKPNPHAIQRFAPLYNAMRDAEQRAGARDAIKASFAILNDHLRTTGLAYDDYVLTL